MFRFKCGQCGLDATRINSGDRGVTSFNVDECRARCEAVALAMAEGWTDPLGVNCPHLNAALAEASSQSGTAR